MSGTAETLCFTCSLPLGDPLRLNHLSNGRVCPTCRDRLLDALPPLLPGGGSGADLESLDPPAWPESERAARPTPLEPPPPGPQAG